MDNDEEHFWFSISAVYVVRRRNQCRNLIWGKEAFLLKRITLIGRGHSLLQVFRGAAVSLTVMETGHDIYHNTNTSIWFWPAEQIKEKAPDLFMDLDLFQ